MSTRRYKVAANDYLSPVTGRWMREVRQYGDSQPFITVIAVPGSSAIDVRDALERAYGEGREDRSAEILGDFALARAGREVASHRPQGILGDAVLAGKVTCQCGRFTGRSVAEWQEHLAYEVLQAAARL